MLVKCQRASCFVARKGRGVDPQNHKKYCSRDRTRAKRPARRISQIWYLEPKWLRCLRLPTLRIVRYLVKQAQKNRSRVHNAGSSKTHRASTAGVRRPSMWHRKKPPCFGGRSSQPGPSATRIDLLLRRSGVRNAGSSKTHRASAAGVRRPSMWHREKPPCLGDRSSQPGRERAPFSNDPSRVGAGSELK